MRVIIVHKEKQYTKDLKKKIIGKYLNKELERIKGLETILVDISNMKELMNSPFHIVYGIEKKKGNLKEIYTAKINSKLRLYIKPIGKYPYTLEDIVEISFVEIDDSHYGEG